jgi:hypothetical protein
LKNKSKRKSGKTSEHHAKKISRLWNLKKQTDFTEDREKSKASEFFKDRENVIFYDTSVTMKKASPNYKPLDLNTNLQIIIESDEQKS